MWKDSNSYSRADIERIPTCFTAKKGRLVITVTCGHIYFKGSWVMHCNALRIDTLEMKNCTSVSDAQIMALSIVKKRLDELVEDLASLSIPDKE